jgi:AAA+ superfamily predicted ATPase
MVACMSGKHLRDLITAYGERDDLKFRRAAQAIIQEEEAKRHTALARELRHVLTGTGAYVAGGVAELPEPPSDRDSSLPLATVGFGQRHLADLVLESNARAQIDQLIREIRNWPTLDAAGLPRRNRVLLSGPPGSGKTSAANAIAKELGLPLVTARIEGLVSSYLGETAANLKNLFEFVARSPYVFFLDEFDSLGKMREDPADHGELRRGVNAVLQQIDNFTGPSIIIAATNHSQVLDSALWRRFDLVIELPLPTKAEIATLLSRLVPDAGRSVEGSADKLVGLPHAAVEYLAHSAKRFAVLEGRNSPSAADLKAAEAETLSRPWL